MKLKGRRQNIFKKAISLFGGYVVVLLAILFLLRLFEFFSSNVSQLLSAGLSWKYYLTAFYFDLMYLLFLLPVLFVLFFIAYWLSERLAKVITVVVFSLIVVGHAMLIHYFTTALNPLGADLFQYSMTEISQTVGAALTGSVVVTLLVAIVLVVLLFIFVPQKLKLPVKLTYGVLGAGLIVFLFVGIAPANPKPDFGSEYINESSTNKSAYFYQEAFYFISGWEQTDKLPLFADFFLGYDGVSSNKVRNEFAYTDEQSFPFLHTNSNEDALSAFMKKGENPPDIVMIVVEGLGRAFSNEEAYLGSYTPFLDSLSHHSLYWENCLSTSGRTFSVLPSLLASLPFGEHGFAELGDAMPEHQSLIKLLKYNGYHSRFMYAGDSNFDNMRLFMERQACDEIIDKSDFGNGYDLLPGNASGFSWGYGDFELYRRFFQALDQKRDTTPSVNVLLTVATHSPFLVNNQAKYRKQFEALLPELELNGQMENLCRNYQQQLETVLYMDDAMRSFFNDYRKRESFENTIFIITGDHRMPDIPMSTRIDRYHVPLIVYSPMIERPTKFSSVVAHFDVTPSLTEYLKNDFDFAMPELNCWLGAGLDTTVAFASRSTYPLMQTKTTISNMVSENYFLDSERLYLIGPNMTLIEDNNPEMFDRLNLNLMKFKNKNNQFIQEQRLYPDSLLTMFSINGETMN